MAYLFAKQTTDTPPKSLTMAFVRGCRWDDDFVLIDQATNLPVDLDAITGLMLRVRTRRGAPTHLLEASLDNGLLIKVDAPNGKIGIRVNSATTRTFPENRHEKAKYYYDAVIERTPGEYEPAIAGKVRVDPQGTRPFEAT